MPTDQRSHARSHRRRRSVFVALFSMLPMLAFAGLLAPGFVEVKAIGDDTDDSLSVRITRRLSRFGHRPLLLKQDFGSGEMPDLLDLEHLFSRVNYINAPTSHDRSRLASFPRSYGDFIVLDDADQRVREIVFKDPVLMAKASGQPMPPPASDITPLGGPGSSAFGPRFDDYLGPHFDPDDIVVVPEPSTGVLFGLGLLLLAIVGRVRDADAPPEISGRL